MACIPQGASAEEMKKALKSLLNVADGQAVQGFGSGMYTALNPELDLGVWVHG